MFDFLQPEKTVFQYSSIQWENEDDEDLRELSFNPRFKKVEKRIRKRIDYLTSETINGNDCTKEIKELFTLISIFQNYERDRN